jgi:hypothetical protein
VALGVTVLLVALLIAKRRRDDERARARELAEALAEAQQLDPGWRLEDLATKGPVFADDANSARCVEAVIALLPEGWPKDEEMAVELNDEFFALPPDMLAVLRRELKRVGPALDEASKLECMREGRFKIAWKDDFIATPLNGLGKVRTCSHLLTWEAWRLIEDGDVEVALARCRAMLNAGRSVNEPGGLPQLVRLSVRREAVRTVERALAAAAPKAGTLLACQRAIAEEDSYPVHLMMRRGERLWKHSQLKRLADETSKWSQSGGLFQDKSAARDTEMAALARRYHGDILKAENQFVEIAKRPPHEQRALLDQHRQRVTAQLPGPAKDLIGEPAKLLDPCLKSQAMLRCAIVGLAAERFRIRKTRWPTSLAELTPEFLDAVPLDPFDGQPLRYRRLDDGVVIYSTGADGTGDDLVADFDHNRAIGVSVGFRLWDEDHRRFSKKAP